MAYVGIFLIAIRRPWPLLFAGIIALFMLGADSVVTGNVARPEAMLWAVTVWSFVALDRQRPWTALALSLIGTLIHPVGVIFLGSILALWAHHLWLHQEQRRLARCDWIWMGIALLLVVVQLIFLGQNWGAARADSASAMGELSANFWTRIFWSNKTSWLLIYALLVVLALWRARIFLIPMVLGASALAVMPIRPQMWYAIYNQMGFMWLALGIPWFLSRAILAWAKKYNLSAPANLLAVVSLFLFSASALPLLKFNYNHGFITGPRNYPDKLAWGWGMRMDAAPYITTADIQAVRDEIAKQTNAGETNRVFFMPEGDALFFVDQLPAHIIPYQGVRTRTRADLAVFRLSRHYPPWWLEQHVLKSLQSYGGANNAPFHERDGTEQWIAVLPSTPSESQQEPAD